MAIRFAGAVMLALVLVFAWINPAFALTRWASFQWPPSSGPVAGYAVYASTGDSLEQLIATVAVPGATLPVESSTRITIRVAAFDSGGRLGPISEPSYPVRLCPGDFDGDEITGLTDWTKVRSCLGQTGTGFCAGADFDLDGIVGVVDTKSVKIGSNACALVSAPTLCLGDFDGDKIIGLNDWTQARSCTGLFAIGACAPGDFNGDGIVSLFEVNFVAQAIGTNACGGS